MRTGPDNATITEALTMLAHEMAVTSIRQWTDSTTPRTDAPVRFFYHWENGVGLSHAGNVCAPWGRNTYSR